MEYNFQYILYTTLIDTHKLFVRTTIRFNATRKTDLNFVVARATKGIYSQTSSDESKNCVSQRLNVAQRDARANWREATAVAILWPSSDISVSCPQAFLACGRTWVSRVFCHLRSRVFANERPTVPSIFNVYGDSGECPSAIGCPDKVSPVRFRWLCLASVCTPLRKLGKKSIVGFYGALCTRACAHSFGCVLPFLRSTYLHAHTRTYIREVARRSRGFRRVSRCAWACARARSRVSSPCTTIRPTLRTRSFTRIEIRVLRGRRTLASRRKPAATAAATPPSPPPPLPLLPYLRFEIVSLIWVAQVERVYSLITFDPQTEMQTSPSSSACLVKASCFSKCILEFPGQLQLRSRHADSVWLACSLIARFEQPQFVRSVSLRVRLARVTDEPEVDDERQARSVWHASRTRFPCVHLCWPSGGRSRAHPSLWKDSIELRGLVEIDSSSSASPCLLSLFLRLFFVVPCAN